MSLARAGNFDAIRIVAACSVIFSHAFIIAEGHEKNEPLVRLLGKGNILGIVSGFLIAQSIQISPSIGVFLWKRFLRIYPGLMACVFLSAFVIAPFFAADGVAVGLSRKTEYVLANLFLQDAMRIPNVLFYASLNDIGSIINGSLWTIRLELACYLVLALCAVCGLCNLLVALVGLIITSLLVYFDIWPPGSFLGGLLFCLPSFLGGVLMYFLNSRFKLSGSIAWLCFVGILLVSYAGLLRTFFPLFGSYIVIYLALSPTTWAGAATRFGDLSYGTYLYGWPVEQVVRYLLGEGATWWAVFGIAFPIALGFGWISWQLIEERALRLKDWRVATGLNSEKIKAAVRALRMKL
jgi:peptidoglycan/LPS O-acetylase OafA/YrhL